MSTPRLERLRDFVRGLSAVIEQHPGDEAAVLKAGTPLLHELVKQDDWLPEAFAQPHPEHYQQYLLHADAQSRFSVVAFVWGPAQRTPIHDHRVWGMIGMLRGKELAQNFALTPKGLQAEGAPVTLEPGQVEAVSPSIGDIHQVANAYQDQVSISIHVYGGNIGAVKRAVFQPDGTEKPFISGYSNDVLPNIWDLSREVSA